MFLVNLYKKGKFASTKSNVFGKCIKKGKYTTYKYASNNLNSNTPEIFLTGFLQKEKKKKRKKSE